MNILHVFSGGLDSTVLLSKLIFEENKVSCISFAYGSKHSKMELQAAREICYYYKMYHQVINLNFST